MLETFHSSTNKPVLIVSEQETHKTKRLVQSLVKLSENC